METLVTLIAERTNEPVATLRLSYVPQAGQRVSLLPAPGPEGSGAGLPIDPGKVATYEITSVTVLTVQDAEGTYHDDAVQAFVIKVAGHPAWVAPMSTGSGKRPRRLGQVQPS